MEYTVALASEVDSDCGITIHDKLAAMALMRGVEVEDIIMRAITTYVAITDLVTSNPHLVLSMSHKVDGEIACEMNNL